MLTRVTFNIRRRPAIDLHADPPIRYSTFTYISALHIESKDYRDGLQAMARRASRCLSLHGQNTYIIMADSVSEADFSEGPDTGSKSSELKKKERIRVLHSSSLGLLDIHIDVLQ